MLKYFVLILSFFTLASCTSSNAGTTDQTSKIQNQQTNTPLFVDVREDDEWSAGHIEGALHVKLGDIEAGNFSQIPKDTPVNLYCRSGRRSAIAYNILNNAGYTNITDVGGMEQIQGVNITRN